MAISQFAIAGTLAAPLEYTWNTHVHNYNNTSETQMCRVFLSQLSEQMEHALWHK